jgi:hypothetical protein
MPAISKRISNFTKFYIEFKFIVIDNQSAHGRFVYDARNVDSCVHNCNKHDTLAGFLEIDMAECNLLYLVSMYEAWTLLDSISFKQFSNNYFKRIGKFAYTSMH